MATARTLPHGVATCGDNLGFLINKASKKTNYLIHTKLIRSGDCHVRRMVCMYTR